MVLIGVSLIYHFSKLNINDIYMLRDFFSRSLIALVKDGGGPGKGREVFPVGGGLMGLMDGVILNGRLRVEFRQVLLPLVHVRGRNL
jgi:hypothetical protein